MGWPRRRVSPRLGRRRELHPPRVLILRKPFLTEPFLLPEAPELNSLLSQSCCCPTPGASASERVQVMDPCAGGASGSTGA